MIYWLYIFILELNIELLYYRFEIFYGKSVRLVSLSFNKYLLLHNQIVSRSTQSITYTKSSESIEVKESTVSTIVIIIILRDDI